MLSGMAISLRFLRRAKASKTGVFASDLTNPRSKYSNFFSSEIKPKLSIGCLQSKIP